MNRRLFLLIAIPILLIIFGFLLHFSFSSQRTGVAQQTIPTLNTNATFTSIKPFGSSATSSVSHSSTIPVPATGGSVEVMDFTKADNLASSSEGFYLISYPTVYSNENIDAVATATPHDYEIYFFPKTASFDVLLLKEPIAETRKSAAVDLAKRLGISASDLCTLTYEVNVAYFVNSFYSAKNLGFPGCPGAVLLPGD